MSEYHPMAIEAVAVHVENGRGNSQWSDRIRQRDPDALELWEEELALAGALLSLFLASEEVSVVRDACAKAGEQYRFYEREHQAKAEKASEQGEAVSRCNKAQVNADFAEMCEAALEGRRSTLIEAQPE